MSEKIQDNLIKESTFTTESYTLTIFVDGMVTLHFVNKQKAEYYAELKYENLAK